MRFIASRMCYPGDENIVQTALEISKEKSGYDTPTALAIEVTSVQANSGMSTLLPSGSYHTGTIPSDSTSSLKSPVQSPLKSTDQLEKEYLAYIAALTDRDEEEWLEAVSLVDVDRKDNELFQEEQRTIDIIDEYYASLRADQARREAIRAAERRKEHNWAVVFNQQMQHWRDTQKLYVKKYMVEFDEQEQLQCDHINTTLQSAENSNFSSDLQHHTPIILDLGTNKSVIPTIQAYKEQLKLFPKQLNKAVDGYTFDLRLKLNSYQNIGTSS
jgi:hypothetical protein